MTQPLNTHYMIKHAFSLQSLEHVIIQKTCIYSATKNIYNIKESTILDKAWRSEKCFHANAFFQNKAKERTIFSGSPLFLLFTRYTGFSPDSVSVIPRRFCESIRLRLAG